jgi:DNA (cytosine-5)-methyltransferase 1
MGYAAAFGIVDASRFGVPQLRRRAVILGVREDLHKDPRSLWAELEDVREPMLKAIGLPVDRAVTAREALDDLWGPQPKVPCPDSPAYMSVAYRDATSRYAEELRCGIPTGAVPDSHRFSKHGDRILALYRRAHETQPPGRLSKAFLLENDTKKDKKVLIDPDVPVSTITTHPDEFIHYAEPRNVTVREMARLQSFPDDFRFLGRYTINGPRRRFDVARCSQVGNAVPPLLAQGLGLALRRFV